MAICPLCQQASVPFAHIHQLPSLQNVLYPTPTAALAVAHQDVQFEFCIGCEFVFNPTFDHTTITYTDAYNNNQTASQTYIDLVGEVVAFLIARCGLTETSKILEIACGNGFFLKELAKQTQSTHIAGYDPAYADQNDVAAFVVKEYFQSQPDTTFDVIVIRHALEALLDLDVVLQAATASMTAESWIYIEVANLAYILDAGDFTLLSYEYPRYFSLQALRVLLGKYGLRVQTHIALFNNNYFGVLAQKVVSAPPLFQNIAKVQACVAAHQKIVIWGIAGRAITALAHMNWRADTIQYGVDLDQQKQGLYIPVTGQEIISPAAAVAFEPELVIVANKNYLREIQEQFPYTVKFVTLDGDYYE